MKPHVGTYSVYKCRSLSVAESRRRCIPVDPTRNNVDSHHHVITSQWKKVMLLYHKVRGSEVEQPGHDHSNKQTYRIARSNGPYSLEQQW